MGRHRRSAARSVIAPGDAADDPAQHVGIDRAVVERRAVLAVALDLLEIGPIAVRPVVPLGLGQRAGR
jgi:hypothetical protein